VVELKNVTAPGDRTDEELVGLILAGQGDVFAEIYQRYYSRAFRLAYGMTGNRESAEDLTQEIFLRTYRKIGLFKGESGFSTWFYRLAVNISLNYRRRERNRASEDVADMDLLVAPGPPRQMESKIYQKQIQGQVQRALLSLKPKWRVIVILKDIEGLSYEEIAERVNCSTGTIASRLNRARKLLAQKLSHLKETI
jgi:RNA polymerase sigma-70 factor (ECF subfamily)